VTLRYWTHTEGGVTTKDADGARIADRIAHAFPQEPDHHAAFDDAHTGRQAHSTVHRLVSGEAILGANIFRDMFAGIRDIVGGRSAAYEKELRRAKEIALQEMQDQAAAMGANAIVGIDLDYETVGQGSMLMVSASGTAVVCD